MKTLFRHSEKLPNNYFRTPAHYLWFLRYPEIHYKIWESKQNKILDQILTQPWTKFCHFWTKLWLYNACIIYIYIYIYILRVRNWTLFSSPQESLIEPYLFGASKTLWKQRFRAPTNLSQTAFVSLSLVFRGFQKSAFLDDLASWGPENTIKIGVSETRRIKEGKTWHLRKVSMCFDKAREFRTKIPVFGLCGPTTAYPWLAWNHCFCWGARTGVVCAQWLESTIKIVLSGHIRWQRRNKQKKKKRNKQKRKKKRKQGQCWLCCLIKNPKQRSRRRTKKKKKKKKKKNLMKKKKKKK